MTQPSGIIPALGGLDPDTRKLLAACTTQPSSARARAYNTFIRGMKAAGLWNLFDVIGACALHDAQASRIDWKNVTRIATAVNSPIFTVDQGTLFDGATNFLNFPYNPSTQAVNITGTRMMIGVYERTDVHANTRAAGSRTSGVSASEFSVEPGSTTPKIVGALASTNTNLSSAQTVSTGLSIVQTTDGVNGTAYRNGVNVGTAALGTPSNTLPNSNVFLGAASNGAAINTPRAAQEAGLFVGAPLTDAQQATFYVLFQALMTAQGAAV